MKNPERPTPLHADHGIPMDQLDRLSGGRPITGGDDVDVLRGGAGNDVLLGGSGQDFLLGGSGNDVLIGGGDNDVVLGV